MAPEETERELLALSYAYATTVDARDLAGFRATFTDDGVLAVSAVGDPTTIVSERTGDELAEIVERIARFERTEHRVGRATFVIASDDGVATGTVVGEAHHHSPTDDGRTDWVLTIEYTDRYVRTPVGWRIAHRTVQVLAAETRPVA